MNITHQDRQQLFAGPLLPMVCLFCFLGLSLLSQPYLLMQPIQESIQKGDFQVFNEICTEKVSVNLERPFRLTGYFFREKLVEKFTEEFSRFKVEKIEWISKQIEDDFAIQSLNLILENTRSGSMVYYKFIFFMTKKNKQWKFYYLRGIRL